MQNWNEKYLLRFISSPDGGEKNRNNLLDTIIDLGIKLNFNNYNSVYQIIDEINYKDYLAKHENKVR